MVLGWTRNSKYHLGRDECETAGPRWGGNPSKEKPRGVMPPVHCGKVATVHCGNCGTVHCGAYEHGALWELSAETPRQEAGEHGQAETYYN